MEETFQSTLAEARSREFAAYIQSCPPPLPSWDAIRIQVEYDDGCTLQAQMTLMKIPVETANTPIPEKRRRSALWEWLSAFSGLTKRRTATKDK